ncbi:MAG: rhodanese-like domain-containing protein [SAR324 cluster bacterium]|nr:rhodanese-like domain-containing protein [SAR324 cluster bacterium]
MIKKILNFCFSFAFLWTANIFSVYADADQVAKNISPRDSAKLIEQNQNNPDFKIVDVRTPAEYSEGHIQNSSLVDFYSKTFTEELQKLDRDKTYLVYCRSGNRSGKTLTMMQKLGFKKVYNMSGGFLAWNAEKLPAAK